MASLPGYPLPEPNDLTPVEEEDVWEESDEWFEIVESDDPADNGPLGDENSVEENLD